MRKQDSLHDGYAKHNIRFSIRKKILMLSAAAALPFLLLVVYLVISLTPGSEKADLNQSQTMQLLLQAKES